MDSPENVPNVYEGRVAIIKTEPVHDLDDYGNSSVFKTVGTVIIKSEPSDDVNNQFQDESSNEESQTGETRTNAYDKEMLKLERTKFDEFGRVYIENIKSEVSSEDNPSDSLSMEQMITNAVHSAINTPKKRRKPKEKAPTPKKHKLDIVENAQKDDDGKVICPLCKEGSKRCTDKRGLERHLYSNHWDDIKDKLPSATPPLPNKTSQGNKDMDEIERLMKVERNDEGKFPCGQCDQTFTLKPSLKRHLQNVHFKEWKGVKCNKCGKNFHSQLELDRHANIHNGEKPFKCPDCDQSFAHPSNLRKHRRAYHGEDRSKFTCDICGHVFTRLKSRDDHRLTHFGSKPHQCSQCDKRFTRKAELNVHMVSVHSGKRIPCPHCDKTFAHSRYLALHIRGFHEIENKNVCQHCNKNFLYPYKLAAHVCPMATAPSPPRPFLCELCGKTYLCRGDLVGHYVSHSEDKKHQCRFCGKRFKHCHQLTKHIVVHTREDPLCVKCGLHFTSINKLTRHERKVHGNGARADNINDSSIESFSGISQQNGAQKGDKSVVSEGDESNSEEEDSDKLSANALIGSPLFSKTESTSHDSNSVADMTSSYINSLLPSKSQVPNLDQPLQENISNQTVVGSLSGYPLFSNALPRSSFESGQASSPIEPGEIRPFQPVSNESLNANIPSGVEEGEVLINQPPTSPNHESLPRNASLLDEQRMQALASMYPNRVHEFLTSHGTTGNATALASAYPMLNQNAFTKDATSVVLSQGSNINPPVFPDLFN